MIQAIHARPRLARGICFAAIVLLLAVAISVPLMLRASADAGYYDREDAIIFDLSLGDVTFTDTTYSGYVDGVLTEGQHLPENIYLVEQSQPDATQNTISVGTPAAPVHTRFEIHLGALNINGPKAINNHAAPVYVNTAADTVFLILDDNTHSTLVGNARIFKNKAAKTLEDESNRFGHAAIEKEIGTEGTLVITCQKGYARYLEDETAGHNCVADGECGSLNATAVGEAGPYSSKSYTRTAAAAAIGSKAEVSEFANGLTSNNFDPLGTLYNLKIAGGRITATGAVGNTNNRAYQGVTKKVYLGGSPGIGVGAGFHQYSAGYDLSNLCITGGYIDAIAGDGSSANIGGGYHAGYVEINIYGGTVNATQKRTDSAPYADNFDMKRGAGIGGGGGGADSSATHGATVRIYGGTVTATSSYGAAIGSGGGGKIGQATDGIVFIYGGTVTATTTAGIEGIGAGAAIGAGGSLGTGKGGQGTVTITGGQVFASSEKGADIGGGGTNSDQSSAAGGKGIIAIGGGAVTAQTNGIGGGKANAGQGGDADLTITGGTIYSPSISGGSSTANHGGSATVRISGGTITTGSIGGGKTGKSTKNIGSAHVTIEDGTLQGQIIMQGIDSLGNPSTFEMSGGKINNLGASSSDYTFTEKNGGAVCIKSGTAIISGGIIQNCLNDGDLGGAIYLTGGTVTMTGGTISDCRAANGGAVYIDGGDMDVSGGTITNNTATANGGAVYINSGSLIVRNTASLASNHATEGGGAYIAGGTMAVQGGSIYRNEAQNGAGAMVADGDIIVSGGVINENVAQKNGGAFAVTNGNYAMTGGTIKNNEAQGGDGGAIYISSSQDNTNIVIRSGHIMGNEAGKNGGALGVYGLDGVHFTITIGSRTNHAGKDGCHAHPDGTSPDEACPIIEGNISQTSGGGIYLSGSYDAIMNMYCLVEHDNKVGEKGVSPSNFMKVEGGTLNISSQGEEGQEDYGNVVIDSSIHVTGGAVTITGTGHNPVFNRPVTVDVNPSLNSTFHDYRQEGDFRTIQYFEDFQGSGQYTLVDNHGEAVHAVHAASMYVREGWAIAKWELRTVDAEGNHIPTGRFFYAGDKVADTGDLIFYAVWEMVGYTVTFSPGQGVDDYYGSMAPQGFIYSEYKTLSPNGFIREGYVFVRWEVVGTFAPLFPEGFTDGQNVGKLTEEHRAVIQLSAVWVLCDHQDASLYMLTVTEHTVTRQCPCLAYHETVSITGVDTVYNGDPHGTSFTHEYPSTNGKPIPSGQWSGLVILYTGTTKGGIPYESFEAPINAGDYTATVILEGDLKVSAAIIIHKANYPNPPPAPEYQKEEEGGKPIIRIYGPTEPTDAPYEYRFSWYVGTTPDSSGWQTWDPAVGLKWDLDELWTSYYVDVRFAGTDNYNPSMPVRGSSTIVYTGQISFEISSGTGMIRSEWKMSGDRDGITISLAPYTSEFESFYIYNVIPQISASVAGYTLPLYDRKINPDGTWEIQIHTIAPDGGQSVIVYIHLDGAERIVEVDASTAKDKVFTELGQGASDVSVSRDSAYTVLFEIDHYKHYSAPSLSFSSPIPAGTTVILRDFGDLSYWYYRATAEISVIPLSDFIRMGTSGEEAEDHYSTGAQTSLSLQFVVDFSRCETAPTYSFINTVFVATPEQPDGLPLGTETVPQVPETEEQISLLDTPTFNLSAGASDPTDPLTQSIRYDFAVSEAVGGGLSKWESMQGLLVVTPEDPSLLPPDARLRVVIGNTTRTYPLVDGRFIVALPSAGSGTAYMTMLSEMAPNTDLRIECTVSMAASIIGTETTPSLTGLTNQTVSVAYEIRSTRKPTVHVEMLGTNPAYVDGVISPLKFSVAAENMGDYTLRASLYVKNEKGVYQFTTQTMDLALTDGAFEGTMSLDSLIPTMEQKIGSLSLMIRIEVVDTSGRVVDYVPLYVILIDTRQ